MEAPRYSYNWFLSTSTHLPEKESMYSQVMIGRFYSAIDCNFQKKGSRADNTYRFVEKIVASARKSDISMIYYIPVVRSTDSMLKNCSQQIQDLNVECTKLRKKVKASRTKLRTTNHTLRDITNQNHQLKQKCEFSKAKVRKLKDKNAQLETEHMAQLIQELEEESNNSDSSFEAVDEPAWLTANIQNIIGHQTEKYSPQIRKLYYSLLADQVPVSEMS